MCFSICAPYISNNHGHLTSVDPEMLGNITKGILDRHVANKCHPVLAGSIIHANPTIQVASV